MGQIELTTEDFDISKIAKSGQCFRISKHPNKENVWCAIAKGKYLEVEQKEPGWRLIKKIKGIEAKQKEPGKTILHCSIADFESTWEDYFDLATPYKMIRNTIDPEDKYLTEAAADGKGIRILKQDLWEAMISFIVANCIMLFGLHRLDSFPRDKWINEIIREKYNGKFPIERYKGFAGVIQQYLFDYTINKGQV